MSNNSSPSQEAPLHATDRLEDAWENSPAGRSLKRLQANPRVKYVVVIAPAEACPACQQLTGTYPKDQAPHLPFDSCSSPHGCCSYYLPYLDEIYP
ncbi:MAG TPA: hypothetical protein PKM21_10525 [Anaerolineales bacterium]|nr:hypothetical protein [Anaerolineales bacterium]